ncbi:hypothetical protein NQ318_007770 [Aromia moschata]|uniref:Pro-Pol polyprotein n=1 Tax=Aromia moschata TaxID=1265417 RepID=A0AAV8YYU5_9CUCU|nr:hypothetical protein NQ318_007770 [Aromia moschata]
MADSMESKKKHRKVLRSFVTKSLNEIDTLLTKSPIVSEDIEVAWECVKPKFDELCAINSEVYSLLLEAQASEEQLLLEVEQCEGYTKRFTTLKLKVVKLLAAVEDAESVRGSVRTSGAGSQVGYDDVVQGKRKFKLPAIQFKQYDGNIRDWLPFWSQFRKIHADTQLDNCDKIDYLVQATVAGSRARQIVDSFPVLVENYEKIIDCLTARFGREDLQIEVYVRELLKLVLNNAVSKEKQDLSKLYDMIETQLRALDTLGITSDKYAALLFPLIESCLPQELLRIWQRSAFNSSGPSTSSASHGNNEPVAYGGDSPLEVRLKNILSFLRAEVENEQRIDLASEGFGLADNFKTKYGTANQSSKRNASKTPNNSTFTAAGLVNVDVAKCIFCTGVHESDKCFKAQNMTLDERKGVVLEKGVCFKCLKAGHVSKRCRSRLKCIVCGYSHVPLMCLGLAEKKTAQQQKESSNGQENVKKDQAMQNQTGSYVFLQTLNLRVKGQLGMKQVRALLDTGSQRSYILKATVSSLSLRPKRAEKIVHCLFGGTEMEQVHYCYDVTISNGKYRKTFEVLDQAQICNEVSPVFYGPWIQELKALNVEVSDYQSQGPIEMLLGADVIGSLYTGKRHLLKCGLVANETYVGWTVESRVPTQNSTTMTVTSMFTNPSITELWQLDVLGIEEPTERKTKMEKALAAKELFCETVIVNEEGRYEVRLPWLAGHPPLPTNYYLAKRRLQSAVKQLEKNGLMSRYNAVFEEWKQLNIIEETMKGDVGHYLPHRPVVKEGSTTAVRPVFDASSREKEKPSLNQCLEKGENLIELIPALLVRFREYEIGVISDIKQAFLQISVNPRDRQFLKFLWINEKGEETVYIHNRVVFGVNSSPFLLGASIKYHLNKSMGNCLLPGCQYTKETIERLDRSFYVDNCVASLPNLAALNQFIKEATLIMAEAQFDLRGWEFSDQTNSGVGVSVLGLKWFPDRDVLTINPDLLVCDTESAVTKRKLLSIAQKIFDPIGFTSPVTLLPKLWLQVLWESKISWDTEVDGDVATQFRKWAKDLPELMQIEIPRWSEIGGANPEEVSVHTFVDASRNAYAAVVFVRIEKSDNVSVHLMAAKSRVAPIEKRKGSLTIPRLELLAATIGARLYTQVVENLTGSYNRFFWSDSATVISWLQRNEEWGTFVHNRVMEIRKLTPVLQWRHIPGAYNPADLPSRGCSPKQLVGSRWWEGPEWLYDKVENWPSRDLIVDEEEVNKEKKKKVTTFINVEQEKVDFHLMHFSKYTKTVRMIAWMNRFAHNCRHKQDKNKGELSVHELDCAETFIFRLIQKEEFEGLKDNKLKKLSPYYDGEGVIRLKSRVSNRDDTVDYRYPVVLTGRNPIVCSMIMDKHKKSCHVGTQGLLCLLREKYWILGGRRAIRLVIKKCVTCRRFDVEPFAVESPPLPADRVRDSVPFEITGVDFAGPLYLKSGEKAWVCLFTCAVYRAVHLELTMSLSTLKFLQVLRRFIARRGRPRVLYSDNGTNFRGTDNAFAQLDWDALIRETNTQRILWRFNPPSASWIEYLGQLKPLGETKSNASVKKGDVVLIGNDFSKRVEWPMGQVIDVVPGKDGRIRLVMVQTSHGQLLRPVQRLYPLECVDDSDDRNQGDRREVAVPEVNTSKCNPEFSEREGKEDVADHDSVRDSAWVRESADYTDHPGDLKLSRSGRKIKCPKRYL